jgi:hypothetical protein
VVDPHTHASMDTHEIKFFVRIRGARTPPPRIEEPVMKIPLILAMYIVAESTERPLTILHQRHSDLYIDQYLARPTCMAMILLRTVLD